MLDKGNQRFALYCGIAFPFVFFTGMLVAGLLPLPDPELSIDEVREFWADDPDRIRLGLFIMIASAPLQAPLMGLIAVHMRRIEGEFSPLTWTQVLLAGVAILAVLIPVMLMVNLAYRPEDRLPETVQFFNDQAWLIFVGMWSAATMQAIVIGLCILRDRHEVPVIPRWYGYFNIWVGLLFIPGGLIYWFKDGPFAWNGVFAFWLPASVFGLWYIVSFIVYRRVIDEQPDGDSAEAGAR